MDNKIPVVSIGLPVYNGERYLRQAVESLLAQDYGDFELIIADNASTDSTFTICREYAVCDKRVRLYQNGRNLGSAQNFNKVFNMSAGKYFMWAACDDLWEPSCLGKCVTRLEANPAAIMCTCDTQHMDQSGNKLGLQIVAETAGMDAVQRVHRLMTYLGGFILYGVIRSDILRKTSLVQPKFGPDIILLMELTLLGEVVKVPEILFFYRFVVKPLDQYMSSIEPGLKSVTKPCTGLLRDMRRVILESGLPDSVKAAAENEFMECLMLESLHWKKQILCENIMELSALDEANLKKAIHHLIAAGDDSNPAP
ncbi:nucleotide-diphospho-sugar transferases [Lucifera butyrica]|uniref:Nucleotide-diphospho-sugar transferases n=1 Tax=Lucifera butyrica TaxID=1351585 RepID=A0A498R1Z4_9FIRM|nr:glycosyltransferase family A protein [Lucifera butyrica]VBB05179.1 nucleotide-diphospho-sugar transferases [Lucifera butyrica]